MTNPAGELPRDLHGRLLKIIGERVLNLEPDFAVDSDLYGAGLDSMAIMQLLLALEEEFGVSLPVQSVSRKNLSSVRSLADLVRANSDWSNQSAEDSAVPVSSLAATISPAETLHDFKRGDNLPMRGADYFVLSFDRLSRKTGQGGHKAHSFLILDGVPNVARLRDILSQTSEYFPMLSARLKRRFLRTPCWVPSDKPVSPDLRLYSETGSPGLLVAEGAERVDDAAALSEQITNLPMPAMEGAAWPKSRFSLLESRDGTVSLIFSWSHLMMDGVGAEMFLQELERLGACSAEPPITAVDRLDHSRRQSLGESWKVARPIVDFFRALSHTPITCLGPEKPCPGRTKFLVHTLTKDQTKAANLRCKELSGGLVNMPFYLACAMRAHEAVFAHRGRSPASQTCCVPVQTRRKGSRGPVFQNHITMFFGVLSRADATTIESATAVLLAQHTRFLRERMGEAMNELMHLMSYMPPALYMAFMKVQMRGPFSSFFHSHTGEFASGLQQFFGAKISNAFHIPGIGTPPGTGIFCNEKNGRLVITMCWHEGALDDTERQLMLSQFLEDLGIS
jgi:acyl carrier protein